MGDWRSSAKPAEDDGSRDELETLRALVSQLKDSGYTDRLGHPIEMNSAYRDAVALLEIRGER